MVTKFPTFYGNRRSIILCEIWVFHGGEVSGPRSSGLRRLTVWYGRILTFRRGLLPPSSWGSEILRREPARYSKTLESCHNSTRYHNPKDFSFNSLPRLQDTVQFTPHIHTLFITFKFILSPTSPNGLFPSGFPTRILYTFLNYPMRAADTGHH
jgi:hypothetical protein